jgi:hypothetical protein
MRSLEQLSRAAATATEWDDLVAILNEVSAYETGDDSPSARAAGDIAHSVTHVLDRMEPPPTAVARLRDKL